MENTLVFVAVSNTTKSSKDNHNYALSLRENVAEAIVATLRGEECPKKPDLTAWAKGYVRSLLRGYETKAKFALPTVTATEVCNSIELSWGMTKKDASPKEIAEVRAKVESTSERWLLQTVEVALGVPESLWYKKHKDLSERF